MNRFYFFITYVIQLFVLTFFLHTLVRFFLRVKFVGTENLTGLKAPVIFASNHVTEIDVFFIPMALNYFSRFMPIFYVSREPKFYDNSGWRSFAYGGLLFKLCGSYMVYSGKKDYAYSLQNHIELLKRKKSILIFPEGGRTLTGDLKEGRGGVTYLAKTSNTPIIPVGISNLYGLTLKEFFSRKRRVTVTFGKPISPEELFHDKDFYMHDYDFHAYKDAAQVVMKEIDALIKNPNLT